MALGLFILLQHPTHRPAGLFIGVTIFVGIFSTVLAYLAAINILSRYLLSLIPIALLAIAGTVVVKSKGWFPSLLRVIGVLVVALYFIYGIDFTLNTARENSQASWKANWLEISNVAAKNRGDDEPIVILGWDTTPVQFYLGENALNIYDVEQELAAAAHPSYLIIKSQYGATIPAMNTAELVHEFQAESVQILRLRVETN